jgi:hypothetical protein
MTTVIARLTEEDLTRWRLAHARLHAIDKKPDGYSPTEVEQAYITSARLMGEFCERYNVDDSRNWVVSCYTGLIYYQE